MMASNNGKIVIEEGAEMTTLGDGSHGVAAYADTSAKGSVQTVLLKLAPVLLLLQLVVAPMVYLQT